MFCREIIAQLYKNHTTWIKIIRRLNEDIKNLTQPNTESAEYQ
jgi:hypothetical protein